MKSRLSLIIVAFIAIVTRGICDDVDDTHVTALTKYDFHDFVEEHKHSLIVFYTPSCGACKSLMPEFAAAATELKGRGIAFGKVDKSVQVELTTKLKIKSPPTLQYFSESTDPVEYNGGHTRDLIIKWMENMVRPSLPVVAESEIDFSGPVTFVVHLKAHKSKPFNMCNRLADELKVSYRFFAVVDPSKKDEITVYHTDETPITTDIGTNYDILRKWADEEKIPLFGEINNATAAAYETFDSSRDAQGAWFGGLRADYEQHAPEIRKAAAVLRKTHTFGWVDSKSEKSLEFLEDSVGMTTFPDLTLRSKDDFLYKFPQKDMENLTSEKIIQFFKDVDAGKAKKHAKSEPIPETNDESVKVVVADTFDEMIFHDDKDVMLIIHAPWCGFCKKVMPFFNNIAEKLQPYDHLIFAKINGSANKVLNKKFAYDSFPTLYFLKAGSDTPTRIRENTQKAIYIHIEENSSKFVNYDAPEISKPPKVKDEL